MILFKRASLRGAPLNNTVGKIWNVKQVNGSVIALAAIIVRHLIVSLLLVADY